MSSFKAYHAHFHQKEYAGLTMLFNTAEHPSPDDVEADLEGEQETLPDLLEDDINPPPELDDNEAIPIAGIPANNLSRAQLEQTVAGISKGVTDTTENGYLRYYFFVCIDVTPSLNYCRLTDACVAFLISRNLIKTYEEFVLTTPLPSTPFLIITWIMNEYIFHLLFAWILFVSIYIGVTQLALMESLLLVAAHHTHMHRKCVQA